MNFLLKRTPWVISFAVVLSIFRPANFPVSNHLLVFLITLIYFILFGDLKISEKFVFKFNFLYLSTIIFFFGLQYFYSSEIEEINNFMLINTIILILSSSIYFLIDSITKKNKSYKNNLNYFEIFFSSTLIIFLITLFSGGFSFGGEGMKLGTRLIITKIINLNLDFMDPNFLGAFASISLLLLIVSWKKLKQPPLILKLSIFPMILVTFLTQSKSSILSLFSALFILFLNDIKNFLINFKINKKSFYYLISIIFFIFIIFNTQLLKKNIEDFADRINDVTFTINSINQKNTSTRGIIIRKNLNLITKNECLIFACPKEKFDTHNAYFDHLYRYGLISSILFSFLQLLIFKPFKNKIGGTLFTYIFIWQLFYTSPFLWWYLAVIYKSQSNQMNLKSDKRLLYLENT